LQKNNKVVYEAQIDITIFGPSLLFFDMNTKIGNFKFVMTMTPINPFSFKFIAHIHSSYFNGWFAKFSAWGIMINLMRDKIIWDWKQQKSNPLFTKEDKEVKIFKGWYSQFYSQNSKTYDEARSDLNW
jgi:cholesterol 7-dehydrogenase